MRRRVWQRELARFGAQVLSGGDLYEQQQAFRAMAAQRNSRTLAESAARLRCPVYDIDGTQPVEVCAAQAKVILSP